MKSVVYLTVSQAAELLGFGAGPAAWKRAKRWLEREGVLLRRGGVLVCARADFARVCPEAEDRARRTELARRGFR